MKLTEIHIFSSLLNNEEYLRKAFPFLKIEYFKEHSFKIIFEYISKYIQKYSVAPTVTILAIEISADKSISESVMSQVESIINTFTIEVFNIDWLLDFTEAWVKERAMYNALIESIEISEGESSRPKSAIPGLLTDALSVSFDNNVGVDYLESASERHDFYNKIEDDKILFNLDIFNKITRNGFSPKSLNLILASSAVGKSIFLTNYAAHSLQLGKNVLFITLEMSAEAISQRIDANLLDIDVDKLYIGDKQQFVNKITKLQQKTQGNLHIKEYAIASSHTGHFKILLNELKIKKQFIPDVIVVDYLNICASSRVSAGSPAYITTKSIAEELRALAVENNVPLVSAIQLNRTGVGNNDPDMSNIADSYGIAVTADFIVALVSNPELQQLNQLLCVQIKNRYNSLDYYKKFLVGLDKPKMRFYDLEDSAQETISQKNESIAVDDDVLNGFKLKKNTSKIIDF